MELKNLKYIHFTGIKGVAMTSLALCAQDCGIKITGTDTDELFVTDEILKTRKIKWNIGFGNNDWINKPDLLITTGAHGGFTNKEVISAKENGIPVMSQAEALNLFSKGKELISVCGVGGKTTISSITAAIFELSNTAISYAIGVGKIYPTGYGGKFSEKSKYFICEADEFVVSPGVDNRPKFSLLFPKIIIATNIEHDHPDIYPSIVDIKKAYLNFFKKLVKDGLLIAFNDNKNTMDVVNKLKNVSVVTYGFNKDSNWRITNISIENSFQIVHFVDPKNNKYSVKLQIPGKYNALNTLAAFIAAKNAGIKTDKIIKALENFIGTERRFQKIGYSKSGILLYDDYAHHPNEIKNVIEAAKTFFPKKRIISIFQPHTYSRTKSLFQEFTKAFSKSDLVLLMDIYSSAREKIDTSVSSKKLAEEISKKQKDVYYTSNHKTTIEWLKKNAKQNDLVITMGAGNVFYLDKEILKI
ncbi:UDP-N-acetylmuramate--L-alanine ligase [Patescibacteria group bacterium]|nr:UDP-N-acetylmuramate--L-alanine ligase [Patescibacteria group bacterium]